MAKFLSLQFMVMVLVSVVAATLSPNSVLVHLQ